MYTRMICYDNLLNISHQKVFKLDEKTLSQSDMFTSRTGRWPSIHWPHDAIWAPIPPLDGHDAYVTPRVVLYFILSLSSFVLK